MIKTDQYSTLFSCLHDERHPVGTLGRGTHHSIFRCPQWRDFPTILDAPLVQDFCVVWDEDHDERIIRVIERIYMADLLSPVMFIGERKGGLTVILRESVLERVSEDAYQEYVEKLVELADDLDDPWGCSVGTFSYSNEPVIDAMSTIVNDDPSRVGKYLIGIHASWVLGLKPFKPRSLLDVMFD